MTVPTQRNRAVDAAKLTLKAIEAHKIARANMEAAVVTVEEAAKSLDAAMDRLPPAFIKCLKTWPTWEKFKDSAQQEDYEERLGPNRHPSFAPLHLRLRLPVVLAILAHRSKRGLPDILAAADSRF
jgi:hypothetical protein